MLFDWAGGRPRPRREPRPRGARTQARCPEGQDAGAAGRGGAGAAGLDRYRSRRGPARSRVDRSHDVQLCARRRGLEK
jgi:hypothetical protein